MCARLIRKRVCFALWSEAGHAFRTMNVVPRSTMNTIGGTEN